jgi:hypothetical protein
MVKSYGFEGILRIIGFNTYEEYLESDLWKRIQDKVLTNASKICIVKGCKHEATEVFCSKYNLETLKGNDLSALTPICFDCLRKIKGNRTGLYFKTAKKKLHELRTGKKKKKGKPWIGLSFKRRYEAIHRNRENNSRTAMEMKYSSSKYRN